MEKLNLLDSQQDWLTLRETQNIVTHAYPFIIQDIVEGLNALSDQVMVLETIYNKLKTYCLSRFGE
ncbi:MAG: hypothetical protein WBK43_02150 [Prolixibacteraceae bacterium]|jgi:ethanolamine utilization cobalamin adenosyltransferase|nr:hypothetical protein [Prolixibacteraceae bacterium]MDI9563624.1 hypothetical protein [Bacteroidota bacterium]NLT00176.1 hypothetical protein [Bacteroidales bacterium]HOC86792.1 hypothetical protein [Prolixibacteraceae bacterium]HOF56049.1 hypothetical protein [Prolixibacteraceae bacterium]